MSPIPNWAWIALGGVTLGGLFGVAMLHARSPAYARLLERTGIPRAFHDFAAIQRYTESRGNPKAGLGRPERFPTWAEPRNAPRDQQLNEANAAEQSYDRNAEAYAESPYPRRMWVFGSGGPYGQLPAIALSPWRNTDTLRSGRVTPYDIFNPWKATVFFVDHIHRLTRRSEFRGLPRQSQNFLALKRGMARPSLMADVDHRDARSRRSKANAIQACEALHIPTRYLYEVAPTDWRRYPGAQELIR